jgi:nucleoid DNA-binding protein
MPKKDYRTVSDVEFCAWLSRRMQIPANDVDKFIAAFEDELIAGLQNDERIMFFGFGVFDTYQLPEGNRNLIGKSGKLAHCPATKVIHFKVCTKLKDKFNNRLPRMARKPARKAQKDNAT